MISGTTTKRLAFVLVLVGGMAAGAAGQVRYPPVSRYFFYYPAYTPQNYIWTYPYGYHPYGYPSYYYYGSPLYSPISPYNFHGTPYPRYYNPSYRPFGRDDFRRHGLTPQRFDGPRNRGSVQPFGVPRGGGSVQPFGGPRGGGPVHSFGGARGSAPSGGGGHK